MAITLRKRHHEAAHRRARAEHPAAKLHAHGTWTRVDGLGRPTGKEEYVHVYATTVPDRFLVHTTDAAGTAISWETAESVADLMEDLEAHDAG